MPPAKRTDSKINQVDKYQGGIILMVTICAGGLHSPLYVTYEAVIIYSPGVSWGRLIRLLYVYV